MRAVAERWIAGVLAAAQKRALGPFRGEHQGLNAGPGMRAIAEGLLLAPTAAAPGVALSRFELGLIRAELRPFRVGHGVLPHYSKVP